MPNNAVVKKTLKHYIFIDECRKEGLTYKEIAEQIGEHFPNLVKQTENSVRNFYTRHSYESFNTDDLTLSSMVEKKNAQDAAKKLRKEKNVLLDNVILFDNMDKALKELVKDIKVKPVKLNKKKCGKGKPKMTIELLLSDIHYGKLVQVLDKKGNRKTICNLDIIRKRVTQFVEVFKAELAREQKSFDVEEIIINFDGDIIESSTMHGKESMVSSEFDNSRQIVEAIKSMYHDILVPIAKLNIPTRVNCVTGNHDRVEPKKTFNNAGENNVSYQIYKVLEMMAENAKMDNLKFSIPISSYLIYDIYGSKVLLEHGDNLKAKTQNAVEALVAKRATQNQCHIAFSRWGHFHEYTVYGRGTHIINGGVPGQDSYAEVLGFDSQACQVINYYVKTNKRPTPFYKSFPVYLE